MKQLLFAMLLFSGAATAQQTQFTNVSFNGWYKFSGLKLTAVGTDSTTHYGSGTKLITERAAKAYARLAAITYGGGGGGITDGPKGDINVSGFGANWKLNDTIVTDNLTGLGQSFQVFRPAGQSYLSATLSAYGVNVFGDSFKKTLIQDGQINLQNSNPFINIKTQTSGVALGIDTIVKHYYIDMIDNLQFSIEQQSLPFLHFTGRNSALYPAPYRGILYLANANTDNVVIGDINAGDLGASKAHKDSKLTVFGNLKVASDTFKLNGKFFANNLPVAKRSKQLYWNPADSTISVGDTTGVGGSGSVPSLNQVFASTGYVGTITNDVAGIALGNTQFHIVGNSVGTSGGLEITNKYVTIGSNNANLTTIDFRRDSTQFKASPFKFFIDSLGHSEVAANKMMVWDSVSGSVNTQAIPLGGSGSGVDTLYQNGDSLMYTKGGTPYLAFELPDSLLMTRDALHVEFEPATNKQTLFVDTASAVNDGILLKEKYTAFDNKMDTMVLTTTGTGAATFNPATNTLNIPTPAGGGVANSVAATGGLSITSDGESTLNDNTAEIVMGGFPDKPIRFVVSNSEKMKIMPTTGNMMLQNGGTYTDISSSILTLTSTTKAFTLTRMTQAQRNAIASPVAGMMIYQTDATQGLRVYNGTNWMRFTETID